MIDSVAPGPALSPFVEGYWYMELQSPGQFMTVLPSLNAHACFLFGDPVHASYKGGEDIRMSNACGLRTAPISMLLPQNLAAVVVRFHPWGLRSFLRESPALLTDGRLDIRLLFGNSRVDSMEDQLAHLPDARSRIACVEAFLQQEIRTASHDELVTSLARRICQDGGRVPVSVLADQAGISERQLARRFLLQLGVSPKTFSRLARFQYVLGRHQSGVSWATLAHEAGFADQPHLVRDIRALSGIGPTRLQKRVSTLEIFELNTDIASEFFNTWLI